MDRNMPELRWGDRVEKAFLDYARAGKGVVLYHFGLPSFNGWTEFEMAITLCITTTLLTSRVPITRSPRV